MSTLYNYPTCPKCGYHPSDAYDDFDGGKRFASYECYGCKTEFRVEKIDYYLSVSMDPFPETPKQIDIDDPKPTGAGRGMSDIQQTMELRGCELCHGKGVVEKPLGTIPAQVKNEICPCCHGSCSIWIPLRSPTNSNKAEERQAGEW